MQTNVSWCENLSGAPLQVFHSAPLSFMKLSKVNNFEGETFIVLFKFARASLQCHVTLLPNKQI